ncbi:TetR/AcrR family transcriptional regulator [Marinibacterium sp. SX1]|uniref:TetR/AcrR family transcriptional regulator n=1 Tax=Marinibacterium sp. SX1 TaxID=3388424 RepID=UPI003D16FE3C
MAVAGGKNGTGGEGGLRDRKKLRRREDILNAARLLFAERGIDGTTMAEIAAAVQVSPPTVFNYFGNKDGILIALITEGTRTARTVHLQKPPRTDTDFATVLTGIFTDVSGRTLDIAGKRVWRYAEAAAIRHPAAPLACEYRIVEDSLHLSLTERLAPYDMRLRSGGPADPAQLAQVFYDAWNPCFFALICDDGCTLDQHRADVDARFRPLAGMIFEPGFLRQPVLKPNPEPS